MAHKVGDRVTHESGWTGMVTAVKGRDDGDGCWLYVEPDDGGFASWYSDGVFSATVNGIVPGRLDHPPTQR